MIEIKNLSYQYKKSKKLALDNVSVNFNDVGCFVLLGENGSGKSTLTKILVKILKTKSGKVFIDNKNINKKSIYSVGRKIGYLFQNPDMQIFANTVYEELAFPFKLDKEKDYEEKITKVLKEFDLLKYKDIAPYKLSKGERQKLAIATIFVRDTKYIILDEPTSSLDYESILQLKDIILKFKVKKCFIVVTHDENFCNSISDKTIRLKEGKIEKN